MCASLALRTHVHTDIVSTELKESTTLRIACTLVAQAMDRQATPAPIPWGVKRRVCKYIETPELAQPNHGWPHRGPQSPPCVGNFLGD
jgi:hypothetical protein